MQSPTHLMRRELWWAVIAITALIVASSCAQGYARLAAPYYAVVARIIARGHPWHIVSVDVQPSNVGPGSVLMLIGDVYQSSGDARPAARVVARVEVGEAVETPAVFWTMLLLWPCVSVRQRLVRLALGLPVFFALEAFTTAVQLAHNLPEASALLAGVQDPLTAWERWARFLEAGGRFAVEACGVLFTVIISQRLSRMHFGHLHGGGMQLTSLVGRNAEDS
jgi:hypothetical protein